MKTHEIFNVGIPRGTADELAIAMRKKPGYVDKFCRVPASNANPYGTGAPNPLDRFLICYLHFLKHNPVAAEMTIQLLSEIRDAYLGSHATAASRKQRFNAAVDEFTDVVKAAAADVPPEELDREISEAIAALQSLRPKNAAEEPAHTGEDVCFCWACAGTAPNAH